MSNQVARILCVGNDLTLMNKSCAVLQREGYYTEVVTPLKAIPILQKSSGFDLLILPATLQEFERRLVLAAAPEKIQVYRVDHFTDLVNLLAEVKGLLRSSAQQSASPGQ